VRQSCLYVGTVEHRRFTPIKNEFTYSVCYYYLDLDEVADLFRVPFLFSYNFPGILSFWRKDYFGKAQIPLKESILNLVFEKTGERPDGPVRLLTNISYLGYCFNPVSFYYCFAADGKSLKYIVSEVTNTPWGERHPHVMKFEKENKSVFKFPKDFHVSPFMPMTIDNTWVFEKPSDHLYVLMQNRYTGQSPVVFDSTLKLKRSPLGLGQVVKNFLLFPMNSMKTMLAIYYQAGKLYLKGSPFHSHPGKE
jgi:uncharacterized protein